ncbi:MAG: hypothetical protein J5715_06640 [Clostridiales bacterium]|nr:hypothetical protein [Clostridiales bacterium]
MELNKEFKAEELNVEGYPIIEVGKGKAQSEKFKAQTDFDFDPASLVDALNSKGHVYAYLDKEKKVKAIYITVRKDGEDFSCEERLLSDSIADDPVVGKMDEQVKFLVAQRATYYSKGRGYFLGEELPHLKQKSEGFNFSMAIVFALLYSVVFWQVFHGPTGIGIGICFGICMGLCFAKHSYLYEGPKEEDTKTE